MEDRSRNYTARHLCPHSPPGCHRVRRPRCCQVTNTRMVPRLCRRNKLRPPQPTTMAERTHVVFAKVQLKAINTVHGASCKSGGTVGQRPRFRARSWMRKPTIVFDTKELDRNAVNHPRSKPQPQTLPNVCSPNQAEFGPLCNHHLKAIPRRSPIQVAIQTKVRQPHTHTTISGCADICRSLPTRSCRAAAKAPATDTCEVHMADPANKCAAHPARPRKRPHDKTASHDLEQDTYRSTECRCMSEDVPTCSFGRPGCAPSHCRPAEPPPQGN